MNTTTPIHFTHAASMLKSAFAALTARTCSIPSGKHEVAFGLRAAADRCAETRDVRDPFRKV